ncbi:MAG: hypothetical protein FJ028_02605 [Chloroflexi bacterium]|nr:hypothetical protein [Chloroflexota bacterium]
MRALIAALLTAGLVAATASTAHACDPYWDWWRGWYDPCWDPPAYEAAWWDEPAYAVEPVIEGPAWSDPVVWVAPEADVLYAWAEPVPAAAPAAFDSGIALPTGGPFERERATRATVMRDRLGSVVIAVGPAAEMWIADRIATSTFVVALVHDRP